MKSLGILLFVALGLAQSPAHASDLCKSQATGPRDEILHGVCQALSAVNAGDTAALRELMADDFALTSVSGKYFDASKTEMISRWTEPLAPGTESKSRLTKVFRAYRAGSFGFIAGEVEDRTQEGSSLVCTAHAFTDIWELRGGRWEWVQSHESGYRTVRCTD